MTSKPVQITGKQTFESSAESKAVLVGLSYEGQPDHSKMIKITPSIDARFERSKK